MADYSTLRQEAKELYGQLGIMRISGHIGVRGSRATSIDEVADENLPTVIWDMKLLREKLGIKSN